MQSSTNMTNNNYITHYIYSLDGVYFCLNHPNIQDCKNGIRLEILLTQEKNQT